MVPTDRLASAQEGDHFLVLSALGPDRPGLVAEVTHAITERGANVEDSRMAVFGAEWGMLILVSGTAGQIESILTHTKDLEAKTGLTISSRKTKSPAEYRRRAVMPYVVTAEALDHEGIVRAVAQALHGLGVNIVSLETIAYNAPVTGSPLFRLEALIDVPQGLSIARVRDAMSSVAERENIDIDVRAPAR
jgi:glycine cleavage system transcriptional repressor